MSELGVFDFPGRSAAGGRESPGRLRLRQTYPDVTVDEVREATGFALDVADDVGTVPPPDDAALEIIRTIDPLRIREREFADTELRRRFRFRNRALELCPTCL